MSRAVVVLDSIRREPRRGPLPPHQAALPGTASTDTDARPDHRRAAAAAAARAPVAVPGAPATPGD